MKHFLFALLVSGLSSSSFAGGGVIVGNGGGFAEFLLMRLQPELAERLEFTARASTCSSETKALLVTAARDLRAHPLVLNFLTPSDYAASLHQAGTLISNSYPALHARGASLLLNEFEASFWTDERTAVDALTEGSFLRMGVAESLRSQARDCVKSSARSWYVTTDLKSYRQPRVGVLATPDGQLLVTDAASVTSVAMNLTCGPSAFIESRSMGLSARGPEDVRWNVFLRFTPACAARMGGAAGLVLAIDLHFLQGTHMDLLNGDPRVRLQQRATSAQVVR